jgi:hypothetical protein
VTTKWAVVTGAGNGVAVAPRVGAAGAIPHLSSAD